MDVPFSKGMILRLEPFFNEHRSHLTSSVRGSPYWVTQCTCLHITNKKILEFDARTFELRHQHPFPFHEPEGWGLTTDGCDLYATTGSSYIYRVRVGSAGNLELVSAIQVLRDGQPVTMLNELEYITPKIWVNQWITNRVLRVDPRTGECETFINLAGLHNWYGDATPNGIAYSFSLGETRLIITGKQWPTTFVLDMSTDELCGKSLNTGPQCKLAPKSACWKEQPLKRIPASSAFLSEYTPVSASGSNSAPLFANVSQQGTADIPVAEPDESKRSLQGSTVILVSTILAMVLVTLACMVGWCLQRHHDGFQGEPKLKHQPVSGGVLGQVNPAPE